MRRALIGAEASTPERHSAFPESASARRYSGETDWQGDAVMVGVDPQTQGWPDGIVRVDDPVAVAAIHGLIINGEGEEAVRIV